MHKEAAKYLDGQATDEEVRMKILLAVDGS